MLTTQEKIDLKRLLEQNECEDNTDNIRKQKHSLKIKKDIDNFVRLKMEYFSNLPKDLTTINAEQSAKIQKTFEETAENKCKFLFETYPDIFRKMMKNELDISIFVKLTEVLKLIEDNKTGQHEGSVLVGRILKEMYLDSAIRRADNADIRIDEEEPEPKVLGKSISWKEYKDTKK